jgi:exopolysaccharide production protein ExoQ
MLSITPYARSLNDVPRFEGSPRYRLTCLLLALWWIASLYPLMAPQNVTEQLQMAADATAQGSRQNQVIVISFAILGGVYLPSALRVLRTRQDARRLMYLLGIYMLWAAVTILWSDDVMLSVRRLAQFLFLVIGVIGLGAGFYSRTSDGTLSLAKHALYASWLAISVLVVSRLWNQSFSDLLSPEWSLKSDTAAQFYIYPVAYAVIAAFVLYSTARTKQVVSLSILVLVLVLLKGRNMLAGTLATVLLLFALRSKGIAARGAGLLALILLAGQIDLATGGRLFLLSVNLVSNSLTAWLPYLTLGNGMEDLLSLDSRLPLWQALWGYFSDHPLIGHGFGAFWNPDRFDEIYRAAAWPAVAAHNGFLDELLATGVVGLGIFLIFWLRSTRVALSSGHDDNQAKYLVFGWLLLFLCFNSMGSLLQSYFAAPTLFSLTALFALLAEPHSYRIAQRLVTSASVRSLQPRLVVPSHA